MGHREHLGFAQKEDLFSPPGGLLEEASKIVLLGAVAAERAYGRSADSHDHGIDEWADSAEDELGKAFEVAWSNTAEGDLAILDDLVNEWTGVPESELLREIAIEWGAFVGGRILEAIGGSWTLREDPLHHSLHFTSLEIDFFPMHAIVARFLLGEDAKLELTYHNLVGILTDPSHHLPQAP